MGYARARTDLSHARTRLIDALQALELTYGDHPVEQPDALIEHAEDVVIAVRGDIEEAFAFLTTTNSTPTILRHVHGERLLLNAWQRFNVDLSAPVRVRAVLQMVSRRGGEWLAWMTAHDAAIIAVTDQFFQTLSAVQDCLAELGERLEPAVNSNSSTTVSPLPNLERTP